MGRGRCSKQTKACGFTRLRIGTKVKCRCRYTRELFRINSLEPSKGCINMFSTKLKKEKAHDESIWSCSWGQLKITKEKERREDDENEEQADRESPMQEEEILEFVVSGGLDDTVKVWQYNDSVSGDNALKLRNSWDGHYLGVVSVDVSTEGTMIAASCLDSTIKLWEVPNGKKFCTIDAGPVDVWTVAFSPDSKHVISGSHSGKIHMYKIDGSLEQTLDTRGKFTLSIAYSPDGKYIASGANDGIINIFDVATSKLVHTLEGHAMPIRSLTFSPDSQFLLTASDDGHMKLYDVSHANVVGTMSGHASWVLSVAFSPDNKHFVSGSADRTVKLWELQDRQCLHTFSEHEDQVWGVKFSPDGKKIVSVSEDRSILIHECNFPEPEQPANPEEPTTDLLDMYN